MGTSKCILCLGTTPAIQRAMIFRRLEWGGVNRTAEVIEAAAGKSVNVAKVVSTLGRRVLATGFAGGSRGKMLRRFLDAGGVGHDFLEVEAETRMCVTVIDRGGRAHTELVEESREVRAERFEALLEKLKVLLGGCGMLVLSGTLTPNAPGDFYGRCISNARVAGVAAVLDATGAALLGGIAAGPLVIKPNREELGKTVGMAVETEGEVCAAMRRACELGAGNVVVTLGAEGAMTFDGAAAYRIWVPKLEAVNTIGSGDAFSAGLAVGLVEGKELAEAARLGAACGCANAMTNLAGEVRVEDVGRLMAQIRVERVG